MSWLFGNALISTPFCVYGGIAAISTEAERALRSEADRLAKAYGDRFAVPDSLRSMAAKGETFYQLADADARRPAA